MIVEVDRAADGIVWGNAGIDIIERTVFQERHPGSAGDLEESTPGSGQRLNDAAAAAGGAAQNRDFIRCLESCRNQIPAGEADR